MNKEYEKYILFLTNEARKQKLEPILAAIVRSHGQVLELRAENAKLKKVIKAALDIKALWEPADGWGNVDEAKALDMMVTRFEEALKE